MVGRPTPTTSHSDGGTSGRRCKALDGVSQFGHGESAVQLQTRAPPQERFYRLDITRNLCPLGQGLAVVIVGPFVKRCINTVNGALTKTMCSKRSQS